MPGSAGSSAAPLFRPLDGFVRAASVGIAACMLVQLLQLVGVIERFPAAAQDNASGLRLASDMGIDSPSAALSVLWSLLVLATAALVVVALHRAYRNRLAFGQPLPVSSRWYAGSWFVPVVNLFAPYRPTKLSWEGTTRSGPPRWLPWWWTVWVLATVRTVFFSTHPVESGWQALDAPYRIYNATTALLLGLLTVAVLNRLAREQRAAAVDRSVPAS